MEITLLIFAGAAIIANWAHTYWVIDYVSNVKDKFRLFGKWEVSPKNLQNYLVCGIIEMAIMALVFNGKYNWAVGAVVMQIIVNFYYTYCSYEEKYLRQDKDKDSEPQRRKRRSRIGSYVFGIILPVCILVFTDLYIEVKEDSNERVEANK